MKVKNNFFMEMVNRGKMNKGQVNVFVKWLKVVVCKKCFIRANHGVQKTKVLELMWTQKG